MRLGQRADGTVRTTDCPVGVRRRQVKRAVVILPITHSNPTGETVGIEIPERVRRAIGLDDSPCWVIVSEHNVDEWPNGGLQPLPGRPVVFSYGHMPPGLFASIKARFIELAKRRPGTGILR